MADVLHLTPPPTQNADLDHSSVDELRGAPPKEPPPVSLDAADMVGATFAGMSSGMTEFFKNPHININVAAQAIKEVQYGVPALVADMPGQVGSFIGLFQAVHALETRNDYDAVKASLGTLGGIVGGELGLALAVEVLAAGPVLAGAIAAAGALYGVYWGYKDAQAIWNLGFDGAAQAIDDAKSFFNATFNDNGTSKVVFNSADGATGVATSDDHGNGYLQLAYSDGSKAIVDVAGNNSITANFTDISGNSVTTYVDSAMEFKKYENADGSTGSVTRYVDGTGNVFDEAADGSYIQTTFLGAGKTYTEYKNSDGSTGWVEKCSDGSFKESITYSDGSVYTGYKNADGSYGSTSVDDKGNSTESKTDADGTIHASFNDIDGSHGESIDDGHGNSSYEKVEADGTVKHGWERSDGSRGSDETDAHGNFVEGYNDADGIVHMRYLNAADGSYGSLTDDGHGNTQNEDVDANGIVTKTYHHDDGSYGSSSDDSHGNTQSEDVDANGIITKTYHHDDGSYGNSSDNGLGDTQSEDFGVDGSVTHNWARSDGSSGDDRTDANGNFVEYRANADGGTFFDYRNADGSHGGSSDDGHGNNAYEDFASDGTLLHSGYNREDGAYSYYDVYSDGSISSETQNADGSGSGFYKNADGSHGYWSNDGQGNSEYKDIAADDTVLYSGYQHTDGSHGDSTNDGEGNWQSTDVDVNGISTRSYHYSDGGYGQEIRDADGKYISSDSVSANGAEDHFIFSPDGSYSETWSSGLGSYGGGYGGGYGGSYNEINEQHGTRTYIAAANELVSTTYSQHASGTISVETTDNVRLGDGSYDLKWFDDQGSYTEQSYFASTGQYSDHGHFSDGAAWSYNSWSDGSYSNSTLSSDGTSVVESYDASIHQRDYSYLGADGSASWSKDVFDDSWTYYKGFYYSNGEETGGYTDPDGGWGKYDYIYSGIDGEELISESHDADGSWSKTDSITTADPLFSGEPPSVGGYYYGSAYDTARGYSNETITEIHNEDGAWTKLDLKESPEGWSYSYQASEWPWIETGPASEIKPFGTTLAASYDSVTETKTELKMVYEDQWDGTNLSQITQTEAETKWECFDANDSFDPNEWTLNSTNVWEFSNDRSIISETYDHEDGTHASGTMNVVTGEYQTKTEYSNGNWIAISGNAEGDTDTVTVYDEDTGTRTEGTVDADGSYSATTYSSDGSWVSASFDHTTWEKTIDSYSYAGSSEGWVTTHRASNGELTWSSTGGHSGSISSATYLHDGDGQWEPEHIQYQAYYEDNKGVLSHFNFTALKDVDLAYDELHLAAIHEESLSASPSLAFHL